MAENFHGVSVGKKKITPSFQTELWAGPGPDVRPDVLKDFVTSLRKWGLRRKFFVK